MPLGIDPYLNYALACLRLRARSWALRGRDFPPPSPPGALEPWSPGALEPWSPGDQETWRPKVTKKIEERFFNNLWGEVNDYQAYANGEIYAVTITDEADGEFIDAYGGFTSAEEALQYGRETAERYGNCKKRRSKRSPKRLARG